MNVTNFNITKLELRVRHEVLSERELAMLKQEHMSNVVSYKFIDSKRESLDITHSGGALYSYKLQGLTGESVGLGIFLRTASSVGANAITYNVLTSCDLKLDGQLSFYGFNMEATTLQSQSVLVNQSDFYIQKKFYLISFTNKFRDDLIYGTNNGSIEITNNSIIEITSASANQNFTLYNYFVRTLDVQPNGKCVIRQ